MARTRGKGFRRKPPSRRPGIGEEKGGDEPEPVVGGDDDPETKEIEEEEEDTMEVEEEEENLATVDETKTTSTNKNDKKNPTDAEKEQPNVVAPTSAPPAQTSPPPEGGKTDDKKTLQELEDDFDKETDATTQMQEESTNEKDKGGKTPSVDDQDLTRLDPTVSNLYTQPFHVPSPPTAKIAASQIFTDDDKPDGPSDTPMEDAEKNPESDGPPSLKNPIPRVNKEPDGGENETEGAQTETGEGNKEKGGDTVSEKERLVQKNLEQRKETEKKVDLILKKLSEAFKPKTVGDFESMYQFAALTAEVRSTIL